MFRNALSGSTSSTWPPEVPPYRPAQPPPSTPQPAPVLPTWYESDPGAFQHGLVDRLLEQRVVMATGPLDPALGDLLTAQLLLLDGQSAEPIQLHLACAEGDLDASLALADALELLASPVTATVRGTLAGPAVAVLCAATERVASRSATVVLSQPVMTETAPGTAEELAVRADQQLRQVNRLRDLIAAASGRHPDDIAEDLRRGRVLTAQDALSYGLVHRLR